jgi:uncharacterized protein (DUF2147 family)
MKAKVLFSIIALVLFTTAATQGNINTNAAEEQICGKWETSEKNLIVQVYKEDNKFRAKIVWFNDTEGKPMDYWTDKRNPDPTLRNRKILGMNVLSELIYNADSKSWENGMIYDSKNGRDWNASAYIDKNGMLKVKGYWHFKFIGRTMTFNRVS